MARPSPTDVSRMAPLSSTPSDDKESLVLSGGQMLELAAARKACRKVRRAVRVATLSGWMIALFAAATLIFGFAAHAAIWMGLAMTIAAFVELRASGRLRRLDFSAARTLAANQAVLGLLLAIYAAWNIDAIIVATPGPVSMDLLVNGTAFHFVPNNPIFIRQFSLLLYGSMALTALLTQGTTAWYYLSREKWIRDYVSRTPGWILQIQRVGVGL